VSRRRPRPPRKGHGALWSIIYIDLMTQIMAFFVIVWTIEHGAKATQTPKLATGFGIGMGDQTVRMVDLPGDVLFASGKTDLAADGKTVIDKLFGDESAGVLNFDQGGLAQRKLVIHGQLDLRVPVNHSIELFNTLQKRGVPSKLVYFPDENHWVLKPQNSLFWYQTVRDWVATYAPPGP
jgi:hypothetical protein